MSTLDKYQKQLIKNAKKAYETCQIKTDKVKEVFNAIKEYKKGGAAYTAVPADVIGYLNQADADSVLDGTTSCKPLSNPQYCKVKEETGAKYKTLLNGVFTMTAITDETTVQTASDKVLTGFQAGTAAAIDAFINDGDQATQIAKMAANFGISGNNKIKFKPDGTFDPTTSANNTTVFESLADNAKKIAAIKAFFTTAYKDTDSVKPITLTKKLSENFPNLVNELKGVSVANEELKNKSTKLVTFFKDALEISPVSDPSTAAYKFKLSALFKEGKYHMIETLAKTQVDYKDLPNILTFNNDKDQIIEFRVTSTSIAPRDLASATNFNDLHAKLCGVLPFSSDFTFINNNVDLKNFADTCSTSFAKTAALILGDDDCTKTNLDNNGEIPEACFSYLTSKDLNKFYDNEMIDIHCNYEIQ